MSQIATTYAQALYDLAKEENITETVLQQLTALQQVFSEEPEFLRLMMAANLSKEERCQILDDSFRGKAEPYVLNFMKILTEKGYMRHFADCAKAYRDAYNADHGILPVKAVTAVALTDDQRKRLTQKLEKLTGKTIDLSCRVDPAVLGGVRLDYDGKRVDGTVQTRLDTVSKLLKNTVL